MSRILLVVFCGLMAGCARLSPEQVKVRSAKFFVWEERHAPKSLVKKLRPGMSLQEVRAFYLKPPIASNVRPAGGWARLKETERTRMGWDAATYEWLHDVVVHKCEVYESPAGHSSFQLLPDYDFVFFDASDRLIGFHHMMMGD